VNIGELMKKYEGTGITAVSAMMVLEDAKRESYFSKMLDPAQKLDWQESQMDDMKKFIERFGWDELNKFIKDTPTENKE
jgi:hypothetical protein